MKIKAAYRRDDLFEKRRKLMEAWAGLCATPAGRKVIKLASGCVVVPLAADRADGGSG